MFVYFIGFVEVGNRLIINSQEFVRQTLIEHHLPVLAIDTQHFIKNFDGSLMPSKQVKTPTELLKVLRISWVQQMTLLKEFK